VACATAIPNDAFIVEYVGEIPQEVDALKRPDRCYLVELKSKSLWDESMSVFIDAAKCGNESRFITH
ncbi:hypothetical protein F443_15483, partial [Phytophthora nicotianae P1569]